MAYSSAKQTINAPSTFRHKVGKLLFRMLDEGALLAAKNQLKLCKLGMLATRYLRVLQIYNCWFCVLYVKPYHRQSDHVIGEWGFLLPTFRVAVLTLRLGWFANIPTLNRWPTPTSATTFCCRECPPHIHLTSRKKGLNRRSQNR